GGAFFAFADVRHPPLGIAEKAVATVLVTLVATLPAFSCSLHRHLARTRLEENDADREAWLRGAEVAFALIAVVIASDRRRLLFVARRTTSRQVQVVLQSIFAPTISIAVQSAIPS